MEHPDPLHSVLGIPSSRLNPAKWWTERVEKQVAETQATLDDFHSLEVRLLLINGEVLFPSWFGYHGPDMLVIEGNDGEGRPMRVLAPYMSAQLTMRAVPTGETKRPTLGFQH